MRALLSECREAAKAESNVAVLELIEIAAHFFDEYENAIYVRTEVRQSSESLPEQNGHPGSSRSTER
jgi:hypothetical protein